MKMDLKNFWVVNKLQEQIYCFKEMMMHHIPQTHFLLEQNMKALKSKKHVKLKLLQPEKNLSKMMKIDQGLMICLR